MKILVTGANGFIGKNLISALRNRGYQEIFELTRETDVSKFNVYCKECRFVFHLAGVQRPEDRSEFKTGNYEFTKSLIDRLDHFRNSSPVMYASSIQAELENDYGASKRASEEILVVRQKETNADAYIYRFPNIFGRLGKPNFNSAVNTFCHNVAHGLPIIVNDPSTEMRLAYIDDVTAELISCLEGKPLQKGQFCFVEPVYRVLIGQIVYLLGCYKNALQANELLELDEGFQVKLRDAYLDYRSSVLK